MKKILIIGARGLLGSELFHYFSSRGFDVRRLSFSLEGDEKVDITDYQKLKERIEADVPDYIFNCAALVNIPVCEENKVECYEQNVLSVFNLIKILNTHKTQLVHFSTDYVFNSSSQEREFDADTNPLNYYGESKLDSERLIQKMSHNFLILRPTILFGMDWLSRRRDFVSKVLSVSEMSLDNKRVKYPIYTRDISVILEQLIGDEVKNDLIHLAPNYSYTKYEMAQLISKAFDHKTQLVEKDEPKLPKRPDEVILIENRYNFKYTKFTDCLEKIKKERYENNKSK